MEHEASNGLNTITYSSSRPPNSSPNINCVSMTGEANMLFCMFGSEYDYSEHGYNVSGNLACLFSDPTYLTNEFPCSSMTRLIVISGALNSIVAPPDIMVCVPQHALAFIYSYFPVNQLAST